ncbi:major facilitator superfamily domain-containing protein 12-like [Vespa crabro]|uniref:major facilitator superfamily domain-containing protein 12-like n=1 Tax=Vespa crabro TaxID=7445 RepID=UPI001F007301|nr:major facilitator superfamily domain-containing protein 12-like [Vespa crabro]
MQTNRDVLINDYTEIVQRLPVTLRLAYGVGHVLNDICASMWFTYLLVYFHFVLGFSATHAGVLLLIGQVADAVATPFVGLHSDKNDDFWLCKYGRRKTWHLLGTICVFLTFPFIFSPCINCENAHQWAQLIYYAAFIIIFQFGWAAVQISHLSLVAELTPTDYERTELIAIRYSFTVSSSILVYCTTWGLLHITNNDDPDAQIGPNDAHKFQTIVFCVTGIGIFTSFIFHIFVKEGNINNSDGSLRRNTRPISVLLKNIQLYQAACIYMPTRLFVNLLQIYIPLYLHEFLNMPATLLAIIPLTMFISSFLTSLVIEKLNTKLGRKISYCIGVLFGLSGCIWIRCGRGYTFEHYQIYPLSMLLGSAGSIILVTSLGIIADFIGHNTENGAFVYGFMSFTDKLGNGLAVMLIQYLRKFTVSTDYYRNIISNVCACSAICGLLMILYIKPFLSYNAYNIMNTVETTENIDSSSSVITTTNDRIGRFSSRQEHVT